MAELIAEPIQTAELESSGYVGQPEGNIDLTENNVQVNVAPYKYATPKIPIQDDVPAVDPSTQEQIIEPAEGFEGLKKVTVNPANLVEKHITPTTEEQTIVPQSPAIGFSQFTVEPVTPSIDPDIQPENIKQGVDILGIQGTLKPPTLITKQITENGTYTAEDYNADGFDEVKVDVGAPKESDVNFYDYDGTVLYAYTAQEALALTELPEAPTHEGLIFQEWNRTLEQLKSYVADYGIGNAGATYITDDGATRIYLEIGEYVSLNFTLYTQIKNGTLTVEIDGTELASATSTSSSFANYNISFTVPRRGNVRIDLKFTGMGGFRLGQSQTYANASLFGNIPSQRNAIVKVEIGLGIVEIRGGDLIDCYSLKAITIPNNITSFVAYSFARLFSLKAIIIPKNIVNIPVALFDSCHKLQTAVFPDGNFSVQNILFRSCYSLQNFVIPQGFTTIIFNGFYDSGLTSIIIPNSINSFGNDAFRSCARLFVLDISKYIDPDNLPTFSNSTFLTNTPADMVILVANQEMLTAFSNAPNISVYANRMVIKT